MSALFNFHGFLAVVLLVICTCTYVKIAYPPLLVKKDGFRGLFWKAARIGADTHVVAATGERLSPWVALGCFIMGVSILF